jgi:hypothetical protein
LKSYQETFAVAAMACGFSPETFAMISKLQADEANTKQQEVEGQQRVVQAQQETVQAMEREKKYGLPEDSYDWSRSYNEWDKWEVTGAVSFVWPTDESLPRIPTSLQLRRRLFGTKPANPRVNPRHATTITLRCVFDHKSLN